MNFSTEIIDRIALLISSIGIIIGIFFAIFLLVKRNNYSKANLFLSIYLFVFSLRMTKSLFYNYFSVNTTVHYIFLGSLLVVGPSLWFYSLQLKKLLIKKIEYLIHYIPFLVFIGFSWLIPYYGRSPIYLVLFVHGLVYCFIIVYMFIIETQLRKENVKGQIKIRRWILLLTVVTLAMFSNSILIFFEIISFFPSSAILFSFCIIILSIYALGNLSLFTAEKVKYAKSNLDVNEVDKYYKKLKSIIEEDKLYLDTELTLTKLSESVGISTKQLSQIINQIEKVNFSQYISNYRVIEAKRLLKNPNYNHYKISAIAYESGFNSISSFNSAFKKITNTTAIKFRESEI